MKRLIYLLIGLSMLTLPLTACGSDKENPDEVQDTLDFELDSKTQVEAPGLDSPQYSIEDNDDSLDDLLGSPQVEDNPIEENPIPESNDSNDVDDILNLLEQTIDSNNPEQQPETPEQTEQPQESQETPAEPQEPTVSVTVTETTNNNTSETQQSSQQQSTPRKVPNTGIYPD